MASRLNWQTGKRGKGYVTQADDVVTWNIDYYGEPDHTETWQESGDPPAVFMFYIEPDGGINDGGIDYRNMGGRDDKQMVEVICAADNRCYDDSTHDQEAIQEQHPGYGHAWYLTGAESKEVVGVVDVQDFLHQSNILDELSEWIDSFGSKEPPSVHHDGEDDVVQEQRTTPAPHPALTPPSETPADSDDGDQDIARPGNWGHMGANGPAIMYRAEPVEKRQQIMTNGLEPREQTNNGTGVYLFNNPEVAKEYGSLIYGAHNHDVYAINSQGLELNPDPNWQGHAMYTTKRIPQPRVDLYVTAPIQDPQFSVYTKQAACYECGKDHPADDLCPPTTLNHPQPEQDDIEVPKANPLAAPQFFA